MTFSKLEERSPMAAFSKQENVFCGHSQDESLANPASAFLNETANFPLESLSHQLLGPHEQVRTHLARLQFANLLAVLTS